MLFGPSLVDSKGGQKGPPGRGFGGLGPGVGSNFAVEGLTLPMKEALSDERGTFR